MVGQKATQSNRLPATISKAPLLVSTSQHCTAVLVVAVYMLKVAPPLKWCHLPNYLHSVGQPCAEALGCVLALNCWAAWVAVTHSLCTRCGRGGKKNSMPVGVYGRPQIDHGVPSPLSSMREEQLGRASGYGGFNCTQSLGLVLELSFSLLPDFFLVL